MMEFVDEASKSEFRQKIAELAKEIALNEEIRLIAPEGVEEEVNEYEILSNAVITDVEYASGDLHVWLDHPNITIQKKVRNATRWEPAEYANIPFKPLVSIMWSMESASDAIAEIECVEDQ